jgi:RHH-type proline utilization regulon transcriptional repressor/proline dehydrogenase/delta 1-pyrroline-5-carboxylate dehydrogenase
MNPLDPRAKADARDNSAPVRGTVAANSFASDFRNEPAADFSVAANRDAMQQALSEVKHRFNQRYPLYIGGAEVPSTTWLASINPSHKAQSVGQVAQATVANARAAVDVAREALDGWWKLGHERRADFLRRAAAVMRRRRFELAAWQVYECSKPWREADADVCEAIDFCEYYATGAEQLFARRGVDLPGEEDRFEYLPRGVAAVIAPWNFPLAILTGMTTAALVTGNTVVMKPSEQSCVTAAKLMEVFRELELPPGVLNFVPGPGETVGAALVEHPDVALIAFTGSRGVGLAINAKAAQVSASVRLRNVKHVIAEMGGKNAIIVDDDADLDEAVLGVVKSAFGYQGQKCSACSRVIVLDSIYETFLARLVDSTRSL